MDLTHKRILITRPKAQAEGFAAALRAHGAEPIEFPVIEIGPTLDTQPLDRALAQLSRYDWLILTSVNGVNAVWDRFAALDLPGIPSGVKVAAIGPKTAAALRDHGVTPDYVPAEYIAEAILPGLGDLRSRWVLLPRADLARPALAQAIQAAGGVPHEIAAYRTLPAQPDPTRLQALASGVDIITFTSSSTVRSFVALVKAAHLDPHHLPGSPLFVCIGPITASTAQEHNLPVHIVARQYTTEGLIQAILDF
jgi:uroporphyrinogen-III synthase